MPGPLFGLRIVEMDGIGPAPFCGMMLADHGAEVIRVERDGRLARCPATRWRARAGRSRSISSRPREIALVRDLARSCRRPDRGLPARA